MKLAEKYERSNQKEPLMPHEIPSRPWEQVGVDLFELDQKQYMITVDYYSNFWDIHHLKSTTSTSIALKLKNHFARHGCPDRLISDNGPQFVSAEFRKFAKEWDFQQRTSSPGNSKGNGKVESAVKTAKNLLRKGLDTRADPFIAILDYRNTPTQGMNTSPVQRLMNRRTHTLLPTTKALLQPETTMAHKGHAANKKETLQTKKKHFKQKRNAANKKVGCK